jgi:hypothetical protein
MALASGTLGARQAALGLLVMLAAGLLGWRLLNLYSGFRDYDEYLPPTRTLLRAGLALDSAALVRLGSSLPVVQWALQTGRENPLLLQRLQSSLRVGHGSRHGEDALVLFTTSYSRGCADWPLTVFFAGPPGALRIQEVKVGCR